MLIQKAVTIKNRQITLYIGDEREPLRQKMEEGCPVLFWEKEGCSAAGFPYIMQDEETLEDEEFLEEVVLRSIGEPKEIGCFGEYTIRELTARDVNELLLLYKENSASPWVEPFFQTREEGNVYLKEYIQSVYALNRPGIYAIYKEEIFLGICGFTEKPEGTELSYALLQKYQGQGIMIAACQSLLQKYGREGVYVRVARENIRAVHLAEKLGIKIIFSIPKA